MTGLLTTLLIAARYLAQAAEADRREGDLAAAELRVTDEAELITEAMYEITLLTSPGDPR